MVHLVKAAEDIFALRFREADAVILNADEDAAGRIARAEVDAFFVAGVFHGVVEQVHEDDDQGVAIGEDVGQRLAFIPGEVAAGDFEFRAHGVDGLIDDFARGSGLKRDGVFVAFEAREREEIVDEPAEPQVFARDHVEIFLELRFAAIPPLAQRVHEHPHGGERRAQFMRDRRHGGGLQFMQRDLPPHRDRRRDRDDRHRADREDHCPHIIMHAILHPRIQRRRIDERNLDRPRQRKIVQRSLRQHHARGASASRHELSRFIENADLLISFDDFEIRIRHILRRDHRHEPADLFGKIRLAFQKSLLRPSREPLDRRSAVDFHQIADEAHHEHRGNQRQQHEQEEQRAQLLRLDLVGSHLRIM